MLFADNQASDDDLSEKSTNSTGDEEQKLTLDRLTRDGVDDGIIGSVLDSPDLWSAAYREAVENLGEELDIAILERKNVAQLFRELEEIGEEATHESAFLRGVKCLRSLQAPLERFKLALDLASPLTNLEPTVTTAFGVIKSVTVVSFVHNSKLHVPVWPKGFVCGLCCFENEFESITTSLLGSLYRGALKK